jgi:CheY-like chemotaxis protein
VRPLAAVVIGNEPARRAVYAEQLAAVGCQVSVAGGPEEAIELAAEDRPDIVVIDLVRATVDGCAVARRLRAEPRTSTARIFVVTAGQAALQAAGCDDVYDDTDAPVALARAVREVRGQSGVVPSTDPRARARERFPSHEELRILSLLGAVSGEACVETLESVGFIVAPGAARGTVRLARDGRLVDVPLIEEIEADALAGMLRAAAVAAAEFAARMLPRTTHRIVAR